MGKLESNRKLTRRKPTLKDSEKKYGQKKKTNAAFKTQLSLSYSKTLPASSSKDPDNVPTSLRDVEQEPLEEIWKLSQSQCRSLLEKHHVLVGKKDRQFVCWHCGEEMTESADRNSWRCTTRPCQKARLLSPELAFSPLFAAHAGGTEPDFQMLVRAAWCLGCKLPNDSASHVVRRKGDTVVAAGHKLKFFYPVPCPVCFIFRSGMGERVTYFWFAWIL